MTPRLRPYADGDRKAVLELCLLAFAPGCEALQRLSGGDLDWRTCIAGYLRGLTASSEKKRIVVAELGGSVIGMVHYEVDRATTSGRIGVSAVHPARQGRGIGSMMYAHVLEVMRARGLKYATADTGGDAAHARARHAYEKVGFVAVPMVQYFLALGAPRAVTGKGGRARTTRGAAAPRRRTRARHDGGETK